jgi:DNA-binding transcriptional LysR family regulator
VVARPSYPLADRRTLTIDDLAQYEWLAPAGDAPRRRSIEKLFAETGRKVSFPVETSSLGTQKALIAISDRLTLLTRHEAELEARNGNLVVLYFD